MKQITKWQAEDGSEWESMADASFRDRLIAEVETVMAPLGEKEQRHGKFTQRTREAINAARIGLYRIANRDGILKEWIDNQKATFGKSDDTMIFGTHPSVFVRLLDACHIPLERAYHRLCCIDKMGREWDQPYFANKANEGETT